MSLPKSSRSIRVNGEDYRWMLSRKGYPLYIHLIIQKYNGTGSKLIYPLHLDEE